MLDAIRGAKKTVNFEAYIFYSDAVGPRFSRCALRTRPAGVEVRVLLDGIGSGWRLNNSDVRMMKQAGCKFAYYHPLHSWRMDRTNRRSHRRVLVVDGKIGFTGAAVSPKNGPAMRRTRTLARHCRCGSKARSWPNCRRFQGALDQNL